MHKKIHIVFTCVFIFLSIYAYAQENTWTSAHVIASVNDEAVASINAVSNGYVVSGFVTGKVAGITDNQLYGGKDGFVAKYSNNSELEWIFTLGSTSDDTIKTTTGPDGSIYVYGNLKGVVNCGGRTSGVFIGSEGDSGVYIIKYSSNGNYQSHFQAESNLKIVDVKITSEGDVVVVGDFRGLLFSGSNELTNTHAYQNITFFSLNKNDISAVNWSNAYYGNSIIHTLKAEVGGGSLYLSGLTRSSSFGVYRNGPPSFAGKTGLLLSSINLSDGSVNWIVTPGVPDEKVVVAGLSYSNGDLFFQLNTKDSLELLTPSLNYFNSNSVDKSYSLIVDPINGSFSKLKEIYSPDSMSVVDISAYNNNLYVLGYFKTEIKGDDFNFNTKNVDLFVLKLDSDFNFWYANKAKERGDFIEPVALDVYSDDEYYVTGNFSKRVYLDSLSVEYLPSNSRKIFSASASGLANKPVDEGVLIDDYYCFVKNTSPNVLLPVLQNDLVYSDKQKVINKKPDKGSADFIGDQIEYTFANETNYETSFEYSIATISDKAEVFIKVIDSTILAKDSSVCGRENFSVNLYQLYGYSVDTIEFRYNGEIVNDVPLDVTPIQVEIIKVNTLCEELKTVSLNKNVPVLKTMDTSLVSCSKILNVSDLYAEYSAPFRWSENVLAFNEVTSDLEFSKSGDHTVYFDKLLPIECFIQELETNIKVILPEKGTVLDKIEVYPLEEVDLLAEETPFGNNSWQVIAGDATITYSDKGNSTIEMGEEDTQIQYVSIDENQCVFALDTFELSIQQFFVPNAFSPNEDGLNETFLIHGTEHLANKQLKVFNTQGLKVFQSSDYQNDWNGVALDGEPLPEDVYYFEYTILNKKYTGYLELKR